MPQKGWFLWISVCFSLLNAAPFIEISPLYTHSSWNARWSIREFASLWDTKLTENVSCLSLKAVADYLVAISWQTRILEPLRSGEDGECTGGFRFQNEVTGKCPLFSVNSNSLLWPLCTPTILWKHTVFSFLTDFKPHLLTCYPGASSHGWELSLIREYSRAHCNWPLASFPQRKPE